MAEDFTTMKNKGNDDFPQFIFDFTSLAHFARAEVHSH